MPKIARLRHHRGSSGDHAVVLSHGITQSAAALKPFADLLFDAAGHLDLHLFDYDWTQSISSNGTALARQVEGLTGYEKVSLVGYSMGGLVSRFAAARCVHGGLETIVTLATPNGGAIGTAQLAVAGQAIMAAGRLITAFSPRQGLLDLTRADRLMMDLRDCHGVARRIAGKRYASVPALYFHEHREAWRTGSRLMGTAAGAIGIANLVPLISRVHRPHDGIVTEKSCNIADPQNAPFSEIDHAAGHRLDPTRLHARHHQAHDCDHMTILESQVIADLVADLIDTDDWTHLPRHADRRYIRS